MSLPLLDYAPIQFDPRGVDRNVPGITLNLFG
jgi:hypothetical protein